jgi:hypothetical protein
MLIFCSQPNLFILKLKCVKVLELVFQKRVFPYYIWILIIYCSFKEKGVKLEGVMVFNAMAILFYRRHMTFTFLIRVATHLVDSFWGDCTPQPRS